MRLLLSSVLFFLLVLLGTASAQEQKNAGLKLGKWEALEGKKKISLEFAKNGTLQLAGEPESLAFAFRFAKILAEFKAKPEIMPLKYKVVEPGKLEVESDWFKFLEALEGSDPTKSKNPKVREAAKRKVLEVVKITVTEKEFTISNDDGKSLVFTRAK